MMEKANEKGWRLQIGGSVAIGFIISPKYSVSSFGIAWFFLASIRV